MLETRPLSYKRPGHQDTRDQVIEIKIIVNIGQVHWTTDVVGYRCRRTTDVVGYREQLSDENRRRLEFPL